MKTTILVNYLDNDNNIQSIVFSYNYVYKDFAQRHNIVDTMNFKLCGKTYEQKRKSADEIKERFLYMFNQGNIKQCDLSFLSEILEQIAIKSGYKKQWYELGIL